MGARLYYGLILAVASILTACGPTVVTQNPPTPCALPTGVTNIAMVFPYPGSSTAVTSLPYVIVATNGKLSGSDTVYVAASPAAGIYFNPVSIAPTPLPTSVATPGFDATSYYISVNPTSPLPAGTYTAFLTDLSSSCYPSYPLGTFVIAASK